jgi:CBS domain-containing protein
VTQSEVLRFVSQHLDDFGPNLNRSVLMAGLVGKGTIYVTKSTPILEAFAEILTKKVSAVAVLDEKQKLIGNVSIRDLRNVLRTNPNLKLKMTVEAYLKDSNAGNVLIAPYLFEYRLLYHYI